MYKVYLKSGKEESLKRFHPWVFSGAIARLDGEPEEGEVVEIYTSKKEFIAKGHFQIGSIAVRVLTFRQDETIDKDFWKRRLTVARDMRRSIGIAGRADNNTYRLVHGEGDNLPGLVIDVYNRTAVMQAHSAGMHLDRMTIAEALAEVMEGEVDNIYYKSETTLPFKADLYPENGFLKGGSADNVATEYGLNFHIDWLKGREDGLLRGSAREPRLAGALCPRTQRAEHVLLHRGLLCLCHAWRGQAGALGRQLGQSHRPDEQEHRPELPRRRTPCRLCRRRFQVPRPHGRPV